MRYPRAVKDEAKTPNIVVASPQLVSEIGNSH